MRGPGVLTVAGLLTLMLSLSGCVESLRTQRQADLRQRAAFDLHCPAETIDVTPLDQQAQRHGGGTTGVSGCGQQATYLWDPYRASWIMNNALRPLSGSR
jgi:hypothetical protein